jgi:hypothetical protein
MHYPAAADFTSARKSTWPTCVLTNLSYYPILVHEVGVGFGRVNLLSAWTGGDSGGSLGRFVGQGDLSTSGPFWDCREREGNRAGGHR